MRTFQGDCEIQVKPDAEPFSLGTARIIPLPHCDKVKQKLYAMEAQLVMSKVQQPTPWCTGKVIVKKKKLNRCVHREKHSLPKIDDVLGWLTGYEQWVLADAIS